MTSVLPGLPYQPCFAKRDLSDPLSLGDAAPVATIQAIWWSEDPDTLNQSDCTPSTVAIRQAMYGGPTILIPRPVWDGAPVHG